MSSHILRPTQQEMMMEIAGVVSRRSTCERMQVGCIITDRDMKTVFSIGYNGTARGLPNGCDRDEQGNCGCIHAEANALIKAPYGRDTLMMFSTHTPCEACAKLIINSSVTNVFAFQAYRNPAGSNLLARANISLFIWHSNRFIHWRELEQEVRPMLLRHEHQDSEFFHDL